MVPQTGKTQEPSQELSATLAHMTKPHKLGDGDSKKNFPSCMRWVKQALALAGIPDEMLMQAPTIMTRQDWGLPNSGKETSLYEEYKMNIHKTIMKYCTIIQMVIEPDTTAETITRKRLDDRLPWEAMAALTDYFSFPDFGMLTDKVVALTAESLEP